MTTDTTLAGLAFHAEFEAALDTEMCAHTQYPEVLDTPWITGLIVAGMTALNDMLIEGTTSEDLARNAEHVFITVAAAGIAAGKAMAAEELLDGFEAFSLDSVDWEALPTTEEE